MDRYAGWIHTSQSLSTVSLMQKPRVRLEDEILAMLATDPESFEILHTELVFRGSDFNDLGTDDVIGVLESLVDRGWVEIYHPVAPSKEYWQKARSAYEEWLQSGPLEGELFQEFGPWFSITSAGLEEWERRDARERK